MVGFAQVGKRTRRSNSEVARGEDKALIGQICEVQVDGNTRANRTKNARFGNRRRRDRLINSVYTRIAKGRLGSIEISDEAGQLSLIGALFNRLRERRRAAVEQTCGTQIYRLPSFEHAPAIAYFSIRGDSEHRASSDASRVAVGLGRARRLVLRQGDLLDGRLPLTQARVATRYGPVLVVRVEVANRQRRLHRGRTAIDDVRIAGLVARLLCHHDRRKFRCIEISCVFHHRDRRFAVVIDRSRSDGDVSSGFYGATYIAYRA